MRFIRYTRAVIPPFVAVAVLLVIACAGDDGSSPDPATAILPPTVEPPPPFDLDDYFNGDEVVEFLDGLGDERQFPPALMDTSPELDKAVADQLWTDHLSGTRVFEVDDGSVGYVEDYCPNGTGSTIWHEREHEIGRPFPWTIEPTDLTEWNKPYLTSPTPAQMQTFVARGYDGGGGTIFPPTGSGMPVGSGLGPGAPTLRIFDHPGCVEIDPITSVSADQWAILGLGSANLVPEGLRPDQPQLPDDEVVRLAEEFLGDSISFSNMAGVPDSFWCADGTGVGVDPWADPTGTVGHPFTWRIRAGSEVAPNGFWILWKFPDFPERGEIPQFLDLRFRDDPVRNVVSVDNPGCSVEQGIEYWESRAWEPSLGR